MIPLDQAKKVFADYVRQYDRKDEQIALKIKHTYQVMAISKAIAKELHLDQEQQDLAELIVLLHDIGRFEQIRRYHTFFDAESVNHALFGIELLQEHDFLRSFLAEETYDAVILAAIHNHNRFQIETGLSDEAYLHACIIRDADKTDILRVNNEHPCETLFMCSELEMLDSEVTCAVYESFMKHSTILAANRRTPADVLLSHAALIYDMHFQSGLAMIRREGWISQLFHRFAFQRTRTHTLLQHCEQEVLSYLDSKII